MINVHNLRTNYEDLRSLKNIMLLIRCAWDTAKKVYSIALSRWFILSVDAQTM